MEFTTQMMFYYGGFYYSLCWCADTFSLRTSRSESTRNIHSSFMAPENGRVRPICIRATETLHSDELCNVSTICSKALHRIPLARTMTFIRFCRSKNKKMGLKLTEDENTKYLFSMKSAECEKEMARF